MQVGVLGVSGLLGGGGLVGVLGGDVKGGGVVGKLVGGFIGVWGPGRGLIC